MKLRKNILKKTSLLLIAVAICSVSTISQAQGVVLEEIIVTAQKRAENIQDIGLSVSAFDADQLAKSGITDVSRLGFLVAGLTYATAGNDAKFNLRGANSTQTFADNASIVGAYVDGVYKPHASQQSRAFFDVERLEFLKGPQGTLYGRNTFAGALNLYTNKPNTDGYSGGITTSYESFNTLRTEGFLNMPVSDTSAVRVAAYYENGDGYIVNNAGQNGAAPDSLGLRVSAMFEPSDNFDVLLRGTHIKEQGTTAGLFGYKNTCRKVNAQGITDAFGAITDCQNPQRGSSGVPSGATGPYEISQDFVPNGNLSETTLSLELNWDAGPVLVKSITSYTDFENEIGSDFDFSPTVYNIGGFDDYVESVSQEIVISSNNDGAFQWDAGAYYSKDESFFSFWILNQTVADNSGRPVVATPFGDYTLFNGTPLASTATSLGGAFADSHAVDSKTKAVFASGEFSVSDKLRLIAGVRFSDEDKNSFGGGSNFTANGPVTQVFVSGSAPAIIPSTRLEAFAYNLNAPGANTGSKKYSNTSWKAGINYDLNDDSMLYAIASTGFLSGSLNSNGTNTEEQESEMVEIGIKSLLLDGSLLLNVAAHSTEYTNLLAQLQTTFQDPATGLFVVLTESRNGGEISAKGIELEMQYRPTDELLVGLTAAWLDAEFGEFGQTSPYQFNNGVPSSFQSVEGETPGWSPDLVMNFFADYTISLNSGATLTPSVRFSYSDSYNTSNLFSLDPNHDQDSYTKTDLRLTWQSANGDYTVAAYVENLEDNAVLSRGNNGSQDNVQTGYLAPQIYGVSFKLGW